MTERKDIHNAMKMPPKGTMAEIPSGLYTQNSRLNGTDINRQVYQIGLTTLSNAQKYREGWERTFGGKKDESKDLCE